MPPLLEEQCKDKVLAYGLCKAGPGSGSDPGSRRRSVSTRSHDQKVYLHALKTLYPLYRKSGGCLYEQVFTPDGHPTHTGHRGSASASLSTA